jgi:hypothetical protein
LYPADSLIPPDKVHIRNSKEKAQYDKAKLLQEAKKTVQPVGSRTNEMSGRPRNRGLSSRDGGKEVDVETDLMARIIDSIKQAKKCSDESREVGEQIIALEGEMKEAGRMSLCGV